MTKLPLFVSMPRSGSTILFETAREYAVRQLGMRDLGRYSEIFNRFTYDVVAWNKEKETQAAMELFTINNKDPNMPMTVHLVNPPIFEGYRESVIHKIRVLMKEQEKGFEHYLKIMAFDFWQAPDELIELYKKRKFVLTRSRNIKNSAMSLIYSRYTNLWHARQSNWYKWEDAARDPVHINPGLVEVIWPQIKVYQNMDNWEHKLSERGLEYMVVYKEDLEDFDKVCGEIDKIYETNHWRETLSPELLSNLPFKREKNYKELISNYDQIYNLVSERLRTDLDHLT